MLCPRCVSTESIVSDSRTRNKDGVSYEYTRRRRKCLNCGFKFTTYEVVKEPESLSLQRATIILRRIEMLIEDANLEM